MAQASESVWGRKPGRLTFSSSWPKLWAGALTWAGGASAYSGGPACLGLLRTFPAVTLRVLYSGNPSVLRNWNGRSPSSHLPYSDVPGIHALGGPVTSLGGALQILQTREPHGSSAWVSFPHLLALAPTA